MLQAKGQPMVMQGGPPGVILASAAPGGHPGQGPVVIQVGPQGPNGAVPVVHPPNGMVQAPQGMMYAAPGPQFQSVQPLPGLRPASNFAGYAPVPAPAHVQMQPYGHSPVVGTNKLKYVIITD